MADNKDMMMLQQQNPLLLPLPLAHRLPSSALPSHLASAPHLLLHKSSSLHKRKQPFDTTANSTTTTTTTTTTTSSPPHPSSSTPPPSCPLPSSLPPPSSSNISKHKKKLLKVILKLPKPHPHHSSPSPPLPSHRPSPSSPSSPSPNSSPDTPSSTPLHPPFPPHQQPQQHLLQRQQQHQHQQHQHQQQQRLLQQQHYQQQQLLLQQQQQLKIQLDLKLQQQQQQQLKLQQHHPELLQQLKLQHQQQQLKLRLEDPKRPKLQEQQELQQSSNSPKKAKCQQQPKLPQQKPSLPIPPQSLKKLSQNPTSESRHQYGLSPTAQTGKVPTLAPPSSQTTPPLLAPLVSPPSLAATPTAVAADPGQKPSKKRKFKAVVDSLRSDVHTLAAIKAAICHNQLQDGFPQSARSGLISASSTESLAQVPQSEGKVLNERDVSGLSSKPFSDSQVLQPVPSKKLLEGILDKLQKKDTYGVFSEPVDPKLVPDYYDFIKDPMDFGTMRKRIATGCYTSLEPFQTDIFLVCSNAMRYNARDTIYFKQARSIQDATRRILEVLRTSGPQVVMDELVPKQKQSLVKKSHKKHVVNSWFERTGSYPTSCATLATTGGDCGGKSAIPVQSGAAGWNLERQSGNVQNASLLTGSPSDTRADNHEDLSGSLVTSMALKDGRRAQVFEENRRSTYRPQTVSANGTASVLTVAGADHPQLVPTGYQFDFPYARSLARFAADFGPAVWKVAADKIQRALPPGFPFGPGWVGEREVPGGTFIAPLNKSQSQLQPSCIQPKVAKLPNENRLLTTGDLRTNRENSSKGDLTGAVASLRGASNTTAIAVDINNTPCHQSESKSPMSASVPTHNSSGLSQHAKASYQNQQNLRDMNHSRAPGLGDSLQSKHNEMPNENWSVSWVAGKQPEKVPTSAELPLPFSEKYVGEKLREENEVNETFSPKVGSRMSSSIATGSATVKRGSHVGSSQSIWPSHPLANEDRFLLDLSLINSGTQNHQIPQQTSNSAGAPSLSFSSTVSHSSGAPRVREDGNMHGWVQAQQSDLSQVVGNVCLKGPSQLPGSSLQSQSVGLVQYAQLQDGQPLVGSQQQGLQARVASQQGSQKFPPIIPHFLQQQFGPDVHSFAQQQQMRLHPQGSSKPAAAPHGGCVDSQDPSLLRHSNFSTQIGTGISQSQNQAWQYASPQFVLQQGSELPFPAAPDLNASLQPTKSHFDNSTGSELQQPDLALQL